MHASKAHTFAESAWQARSESDSVVQSYNPIVSQAQHRLASQKPNQARAFGTTRFAGSATVLLALWLASAFPGCNWQPEGPA